MRGRFVAVVSVLVLLFAAAVPVAAETPPPSPVEASSAPGHTAAGSPVGTDGSRQSQHAAAELIDDLVAQVRGLGLPAWLTRSLTAKLVQASRALERGFTVRAINRLDAFIDWVDVYAGWRINQADAAALISEARHIIDLLRTPVNQAPVVTNPGLQSAVVGAWVSLQVVGWDPDGGGVTWSASGLPGGLSMNAATGLVSGTVTAAPGDYAVTVTARDTDVPQMSGSASFTWRVSSGSGSPGVVEVRVRSSGDDVEEHPNGWLYVNSSDLELVQDGSATQKVGIRFTGVAVPKGAVIVNAWVQFTVDEYSTGSVSVRIRGNDVGNAAGFSGSYGVSSRVATGASVMWSPPDWVSVGEAGVNQRTPSLVPLVQALVNRADWAPGNAMAFLIDGSGWRTAESYDGSPPTAPLLHIEYRIP
jgi:hypothetical protein